MMRSLERRSTWTTQRTRELQEEAEQLLADKLRAAKGTVGFIGKVGRRCHGATFRDMMVTIESLSPANS